MTTTSELIKQTPTNTAHAASATAQAQAMNTSLWTAPAPRPSLTPPPKITPTPPIINGHYHPMHADPNQFEVPLTFNVNMSPIQMNNTDTQTHI